ANSGLPQAAKLSFVAGGYCPDDADRGDRAGACSPTWDRGRLVGGRLSLAGRTRYTRRREALFNRLRAHASPPRVKSSPTWAGDGRIGRRCRRVDVRCQHRVHVFRYATLLARDTRNPAGTLTAKRRAPVPLGPG